MKKSDPALLSYPCKVGRCAQILWLGDWPGHKLTSLLADNIATWPSAELICIYALGSGLLAPASLRLRRSFRFSLYSESIFSTVTCLAVYCLWHISPPNYIKIYIEREFYIEAGGEREEQKMFFMLEGLSARCNWKNDAIFMMLSLMKIKTGNQTANAAPNWACGLYGGTHGPVFG